MDSTNQDLQASFNIIKLLERSNYNSEYILNSLPGIFTIVNEKFEILRGNSNLSGYFGTDVDGLLRRSLTDIFNKDSWEIFKSQVSLLSNKENPIEGVDFELSIMDAKMLSGDKAHYWHIRKMKTENKVEGDLFIVIGEDISKLRESEKNLCEIFTSIPLGIFTINVEGIIENFHSSYLEHLLIQSKFEGLSIKDVLFQPAMKQMTEEDQEGIQAVYYALGQDEQKYNMLKSFFPRQIFHPHPELLEKGRWLEITYQPVFYNGVIKRLLVILEDKTAVVRAEAIKKQALQHEDKSIKRVLQLKEVDRQGLTIFMKELSELIKRLKKELEIETTYEQAYSTLHGIKGIARVAGFSFLKTIVHDLESIIQQKKPFKIDDYRENFLAIIDEFEEIHLLYRAIFPPKQSFNRLSSDSSNKMNEGYDSELTTLFTKYHDLLSEPNSLHKKFQSYQLYCGILSFQYSYVSTLEKGLRICAEKTANKLNKKVILNFDWGNILINNNILSIINECVQHLLNNAIDHGIELPNEREKVNKEATGTIDIAVFEKEDSVYFEVSDDGRGIDVDTLRTKIYKKRIKTISEVAVMQDSEVLQLVLHPGFSTADKVTDISGRGIGLCAVTSKLDEYCGIIQVDSKKGKGSIFSMSAQYLGNDDLKIEKKCYPLSYLKKVLTEYFRSIKQENNFQADMNFTPAFNNGVFFGDLEKSVVALTTFLSIYATRGELSIVWSISDECNITCQCNIIKEYSDKKSPGHFSLPVDICQHFLFQHKGSIEKFPDSFSIQMGYALYSEQLPKLNIGFSPMINHQLADATMRKINDVAANIDVNIEFTEEKKATNMMIYASRQEIQKIPNVLSYPGFVLSSGEKIIQRDMLSGLESIIKNQ